MLILRDLHRQAYLRMMRDGSPLQKMIANRAEELADRCLAAIFPITVAGQQLPPASIQDWALPVATEIPKREYLVDAFKAALQLRKWLPLAQKCFEFFVPLPGSSPLVGTALKSDEEPVGDGEKVRYCLLPGVAEYSSEMITAVDLGPRALFSSGRNIVEASEEQRKDGRIISPSVVVTVD